jgi:hypothetical protein
MTLDDHAGRGGRGAADADQPVIGLDPYQHFVTPSVPPMRSVDPYSR